jgi:hypothetical protein
MVVDLLDFQRLRKSLADLKSELELSFGDLEDDLDAIEQTLAELAEAQAKLDRIAGIATGADPAGGQKV